jgi:hypothetical protein
LISAARYCEGTSPCLCASAADKVYSILIKSLQKRRKAVKWPYRIIACLSMLVIASVSLRGAIDGDEASGTLIVLNKSDATASLILLETGEVVRTLGTGIGPHEVAVSPDGKLAVVSNYGGRGQPGSSLTVLDASRAPA